MTDLEEAFLASVVARYGEPVAASVTPTPTNADQRTSNPLRPARLNEMIGQERTKKLIARVLEAGRRRRSVLDHVLLVGPSGTGKSTLANVIANELGTDCYQIQAPVSHETLLELRETMQRGDVLFIDEIHQQAIMERRGRSSSTQPEVLYQVLEDRTLVTTAGPLPFPEITVIGGTTDEGLLPDAFVNRFPLRPILDLYTQADLTQIAKANASTLRIELSWDAARLFASSCRGIPRQINNYVRNGVMLADAIDIGVAEEVVRDMNRTTDDGLTLDMQRALVFLFKRGRHQTAKGVVTYKSSVQNIATAIGKSRDTKVIQLRVEPYLIEKGYLQVGHGGRSLTPAGRRRAEQLAKQGVR